VLYRLFGIHLKLGLALNVVFSTATVGLLYYVGRRVFDRSAGRLAGAIWAILPGPLYFTGLFMSESMFIFLLVGFLALAISLPDRRWVAVVLGIALGLAALTRGEGLLMPIIPLAMWWGRVPRREWLTRGAVLLATMALTIAPWTIRNAVVMDAFIPVANNASWTLYAGHNPKANGGPIGGAQLKVSDAGRSEAERAAERRHAAIDWALHNPLKELGLIPRRLIALNGPSSGLIAWINQGTPDQRQLGLSSILVFSVLGDAFGYALLAATLASLALIGVRRLWRTHPAMQGILAYLALCLVNYGLVYFGQYRYRIPMEPFMVLIAAPLLVAVWRQRGALRVSH
jgi:4-amino-4-deoxy-L-arabinose transferase-like glycosyltransferase